MGGGHATVKVYGATDTVKRFVIMEVDWDGLKCAWNLHAQRPAHAGQVAGVERFVMSKFD